MSYEDLYKKYKNKYIQLKQLIQKGGAEGVVNINQQLITACKNGNLEEVNRLLSLDGIDVNTSDQSGTVLHHAIRINNVDIVNRLIQAGADVNLGDFQGLSPLYHASGNNLVIVNTLLLAGADPNLYSEDDLTPLVSATVSGNLEVFNRLIEAGANINAKDSAGDSILMYACVSNNLSIVNRLIQLGVNLDDINNQGLTAIMQTSQLSIIDSLINAGANINILDRTGRNVLNHNYENNNFDIVRRLIEAGAVGGPALQAYQDVNVDGYIPRKTIVNIEDRISESDLISALTRKGDTKVPDAPEVGKKITEEENKTLRKYLEISTCGICMTNMKYVTICKNGHQFCGTCTRDLIDRRENRCPTCRENIESSKFKIAHKKYLKHLPFYGMKRE